MMRTLALGLLVAATASLPGCAAEPDGLPSLINEKEALRISIQGWSRPKLATQPRVNCEVTQ